MANNLTADLTDLYICICKLTYNFIYLSPCISFISSLKCLQVSFSVLQRQDSVPFYRTYINKQLFFSLYPLICHQLMLGFSCMTSLPLDIYWKVGWLDLMIIHWNVLDILQCAYILNNNVAHFKYVNV